MSFEGKAEFFAQHYRSGRGRIRLEAVLARLVRTLPPPPASILDAGGGTGAFAVPLARRGYDVTVLDGSEEWLAEAGRAGAAAGVHLRLVAGRAEDAGRLAPGPFDAVLCHTVLIYADDPAALLRALRGVAAPGAVLSSLEKNRDALSVRPAGEGDFREALRVLDDPVAAGRLGIPNRALRHGELRGLMIRTGWLPEAWAGVRVHTDAAPEAMDPAEFDVAMELERRTARREPHRRFGRLLHVLARAWEPEPLDAIQARSIARASPATLEAWPPERALAPGDLDAFVEHKRYAVLSSTRPDGRPHSTMVAYAVREGRFWLPAVAGAQRVRNVEAEPTASLIIADGEEDRHVAVLIEGPAGVGRDLDWLREVWRERYGSAMAWADSAIELVPTRVLSHDARE